MCRTIGVGSGLGVLSVDPAFQPLAEHSAPRCSAQASALAIHDPNLFAGPTSSTDSTANRLGLAGGATRGLCCGHLGRSSGASQRLGRASFTHAATTGMRGPGVESWCELHVRGGCGHSRSTRRTSKLAVGVLSWRERETAAEEPSAVASQRLPGSPSGSPCPF